MFSRSNKLAQQTAQRLISGHLTLIAWWALKNAGLFDAILKVEADNPGDKGLELLVHATRASMAPDVLYALVNYLQSANLLSVTGDRATLTPEGRALLQHEDGLLELVRSYQPVVNVVEHMLARLKIPGGAVVRRKTETLAEAQAKRYAAELFPAISELIASRHFSHLLDLNCGAGDLLMYLAKQHKNAVGVGICADGALSRRANTAFSAAELEKRLISVPANPLEALGNTRATFERIGISRQLWTDLDCLIATNIFSETHARDADLRNDSSAAAHVTKALSSIPKNFPKAHLLLIEPTASPRFDKQYYAPEITLLMQLCKTPLFSAAQWHDLIKQAKLHLIHEAPLATDGLTLFLCKP
ncbi:MAG TPA: hypothetical protein VM008_08060 [Phycisphaerae bacterium]|nr:hypothetical protein [Phycisphaerae bacterium]